MSTYQCPNCGLPRFPYGSFVAGMQCKCFEHPSQSGPIPYAPFQPGPDGCKPFVQLTEERVRQIVREELKKGTP